MDRNAISVFAGVYVLVCPLFVQAQAVQLPTLNVSGVSTTVSVPDRGSALLGGVSRANSGSVSRGTPGLSHIPGAGRLFGNRAIGQNMSTGSSRVTVTIHDLRAMDEALLAEAAANSRDLGPGDAAVTSAMDRRADFLTRNLATRSASEFGRSPDSVAKQPSVEEIRQQHEAERAERNHEAVSLIEQGRQAEADGKPNVAKIFYNMAARRATGEVKTEATLCLEKLSPQKVAVKRD